VRSAISQALNLRIKLARSSLGYVYQYPYFGQPYDKEWMESVHDHRSKTAVNGAASVLICLRPAIHSEFNNDLILNVSALVMLQGFGEPSVNKIPFLD